MLKSWKVTADGSYIDEKKTMKVSIKDLGLGKNDYISIRIGIKDDAKNIGGINIFGDKFGDYPQHILMKIDY
jgi:predicted transcriptional regulator